MNANAEGSKGTVLLVDDDPFNIELMEAFLHPVGFATVAAGNGDEAWSLLTTGDAVRIDVIVLDRMMPGLDGMGLLARLKADPCWRDIPVIMQTAAAERHQVVEGVRQGAYYYLTKPYAREVLAAIVHAAVADHTNLRRLREQKDRIDGGMTSLTQAEYACNTLDAVRALASHLSTQFPDPDGAVLGISELLLNAHGHGNLGIDYDDKTRLLREARWEIEVLRREQLPENAAKRVRARLEKHADRVELTITDDGPGFDWRPYLELDANRAFDTHGRGIAMARMLSFDELEFLAPGNAVRGIAYRKRPALE